MHPERYIPHINDTALSLHPVLAQRLIVHVAGQFLFLIQHTEQEGYSSNIKDGRVRLHVRESRKLFLEGGGEVMTFECSLSTITNIGIRDKVGSIAMVEIQCPIFISFNTFHGFYNKVFMDKFVKELRGCIVRDIYFGRFVRNPKGTHYNEAEYYFA